MKRISQLKFLYREDGEIRAWTVPIVLFLVVFAAYGLYFNHLGFYWDDWSFTWTHYFQGLAGLKTLFFTRPLRAFIENAEYQLIGLNPSLWQLYSIGLRWLASISLWWFLRQLWKEQNLSSFMIALIYSVYPGFSQQSISVTYHYMWLFQTVLFISFGMMVRAIKNKDFFYIGMVIALVLSAIQLFAIEYMFGTELLRVLFIWIAVIPLYQTRKERIRSTLLYISPFWILTLIYLYWRVFIFKFPYYQPSLFRLMMSDPTSGIRELAGLISDAFKVTTFGAWENSLQVSINTWGMTRFSTIYPILLIASLLLLIFYQNNFVNSPSKQYRIKAQLVTSWQLIAIGLFGFLLAGIPYYVTGLKVSSSFEDDRLAISYIFSISILLSGLINLFRDSKQSIVLVSALASLALGAQFYNAATYRSEADSVNSLAWQLSWRIPALKENTALLTDNLGFKFNDDEALTYLINWIYAPQNGSTHFPYSVQLLEKRLGKEIPALSKNQDIYANSYLVADFKGKTDNSILFYYNPPSCLKILDPEYDQGIIFAPIYTISHDRAVVKSPQILSPLASQALKLSNVSLINPLPAHIARPPLAVFKDDPKTTWCYFFQKAEVARQIGDWEQVAAIAGEAAKGKFYPQDLSENLPFIEAYGRLGRWDEFERSFYSVSNSVPALNPALCGILSRAKDTIPSSQEGSTLITQMKKDAYCTSSAP